MEQTKFKRFKRIATNNLLVVIMTLMFTLGSINIGYSTITNKTPEKTYVINNVKTQSSNQTVNQSVNNKDSIKEQLIKEVSNYVNRFAPRANKFIPKYLVHAGLTNNIDICFMMAQTQIETAFGTTGAGKEGSRRSMFGVIKRHYPNYEVAINHYCEILKKYYLVKGRTEQHLMVKYITGSGAKYAGDPRYEKSLTAAYNHIKRTTNIYSLQQKYKKG